eukprot:5637758-Alexandrium_andersonii.AAC.1
MHPWSGGAKAKAEAKVVAPRMTNRLAALAREIEGPEADDSQQPMETEDTEGGSHQKLLQAKELLAGVGG